jgi:inosose dehydratase
MALQFAYSTINWGTKADLAAVFVEIRSAGWGAVELFDHALDWLGSIERLRELLGGLRPAALFGGLEVPVSAESLTIHNQRIEYAGRLGATMYGLVGGTRLRQRPPTQAEYAELAAACEALAAFGADWGVTAAYHPHTGCTIETQDEIDLLLDQTQHLKLCLDASHIALVGEDPAAHVRKYCERLGYVHVKDWARGRFVELGEGTLGIDFPAFFRALDEIGFKSWVVVENSRSDISPTVSAQVNAAYLRRLGFSLGALS